jgi:hypothetical protein
MRFISLGGYLGAGKTTAMLEAARCNMRSISYVVSNLRLVFSVRRRSASDHRSGNFPLRFADLLATSSFPEATDLLVEHIRRIEDVRIADDFDTVHDSRRQVSPLSGPPCAQGLSDVTELAPRHYYGQRDV